MMMRSVLLPQAVRLMLPAIISQLVVLLKDTALGFLVTYDELLKQLKIRLGFWAVGTGTLPLEPSLRCEDLKEEDGVPSPESLQRTKRVRAGRLARDVVADAQPRAQIRDLHADHRSR